MLVLYFHLIFMAGQANAGVPASPAVNTEAILPPKLFNHAEECNTRSYCSIIDLMVDREANLA